MQFCCRDGVLRFQGWVSFIDTWKAFLRWAYNGINHLLKFQKVPHDYHVDDILRRIFGEVLLVMSSFLREILQVNCAFQHCLDSSLEAEED